MALTDKDPILLRPITDMDVSREFKAMAKVNGYKTLGEILESNVSELPRRPQSGYRMLKEFLDILDEHKLIDLVKD